MLRFQGLAFALSGTNIGGIVPLFPSLSAAWAAAKRAIGTLKGLQLT
jgi:hypothetical protein